MSSTKISIRWTDEVLLYVLVHAKGDFDVALETILRHEATGRPPEELMHLLSGGRRHYLEGSPSSHRRRRSYTESETDKNQSLRNDPDLFGQAAEMGGGGEQPVALHRNWSEGAAGPSYGYVPPSSSTLLLEGEGTETETDALILSRRFAFDFDFESPQSDGSEEQEAGVLCLP